MSVMAVSGEIYFIVAYLHYGRVLGSLKLVLSVPVQTNGIGVEANGRRDPLAVSRSDHLCNCPVFDFPKAFAHSQSEVIFYGDKAAVEEAIKGGGETNPVRWVCPAAFIDTPRNDVSSNEALNDWQPCYAATSVVTTQDGIAEERLVQSLLCRDDSL